MEKITSPRKNDGSLLATHRSFKNKQFINFPILVAIFLCELKYKKTNFVDNLQKKWIFSNLHYVNSWAQTV